ncbi:hypothetical protein BTVI_94793 [Pitangus sulphuratus]|nr:hypothetical protein BTVI_94793 [Pitangus sulphuratus]
MDGSGFIGFDEEILDYLPVFKYAQRSQQEHLPESVSAAAQNAREVCYQCYKEEVVDWDEVSPQSPLLQAEQTKCPQLVLIRLPLKALQHLYCHPFGTLQEINIFPILWCPKLHTIFKVQVETVAKDEEKAEVLIAFFASGLNSKISCSSSTQPSELEDKDREQNKAPHSPRDYGHDLLHHLGTHKPTGPDVIHPRVLRELVEVVAETRFIVYLKSWLNGEVPVDWKLANVAIIYQRAGRRIQGITGLSSTSVPGKVIEKIILNAINQQVQDNSGIRLSQHEFMKGRSCLTNLISICDKGPTYWITE